MEKDKKTPKKNASKSQWTLVPQAGGVTCLKHQDEWYNWCTDCTPPSWRCHKLGVKHKKFVHHQTCKKKEDTATAATLAATESNTAAILAVIGDCITHTITPHKATTISWAGLMSVMDD
eukprot:15326270-Ditylum_brightwellii.AAC.1